MFYGAQIGHPSLEDGKSIRILLFVPFAFITWISDLKFGFLGTTVNAIYILPVRRPNGKQISLIIVCQLHRIRAIRSHHIFQRHSLYPGQQRITCHYAGICVFCGVFVETLSFVLLPLQLSHPVYSFIHPQVVVNLPSGWMARK